MNEIWDWDDLRLFLAVTRARGLAGAVTAAGVSTPTLSRRMLSFERSLGVTLFNRRRDGYDLTPSGAELFVFAESVEMRMIDIDRWRSASEPQSVVRIAAGGWMSVFLAQHLSELISGELCPSIEISSASATADLLRREANLGLRNRRPETLGLAGRRLTEVDFAIYGERAFIEAQSESRDKQRFVACPWVQYAPIGPKVPSAVWLDDHLPRSAKFKCSTTQATLEAVRAGCGLCILPCFIGDVDPNLARASGLIADLRHDQWLVSHDDDRHNATIRQVAKRLTDLVKSNSRLFCGDHGTAPSDPTSQA